MKKVLISAMAIFAFGITSAQQIKFGVKAGANVSTFSGDAVDSEVTGKVGFHVGGLVEFKFTDKLALQPEILYSMQGAKVVRRGFNGDVNYTDDYKQNLNYLNVPVMLKYYPIGGFYLEGGPQVGFLIGAKSKVESTQTDLTGTIHRYSSEVDAKDNYKSIDVAFNLGLGYDFTPNFYAGARYSLGLTNVADYGNTDSYEIDQKNNIFSVSLGYKF